MKEIVSIVNQKGGTGKTTTAHALGVGLGKRGYRVLFIDLDGQANLTDTLQADRKQSKILDLFMKKVSVKDIIQKTSSGDILTGSEDLFQADVMITGTRKEYRLKEALNEIMEDYDYVIIDTSHVLGILALNALVASNSVIVASHAEGYNLTGVERLGSIVRDIVDHSNRYLSIKGILLTKFKERTILNRNITNVMDEVAKRLGTKVFKTKIRDTILVSESQIKHLTVLDYAPESMVAKEYEAFVDEFMGDIEV